MKVILRGQPKPKNRLVQFECPCCESVLEKSLDRLGVRMYRNEIYYTFMCPVCNEECMVDEGEIEEVEE